MMLDEEYKLLSSSLCNFLYHPVTLVEISPSAQFFKHPDLCSYLEVRDKVLHTENEDKITVQYTLIILPLDG
jgi:hypothetical protein